MSPSAPRVAFATAAEGGVALGDPTGAHVLLTPDAIVHRRGAVQVELDWRDVEALEVDASASRSRRPGGLAVLIGAAAASIGLDWGPGTAPVTVTAEDRDGSIDLECDGFIGHGYWAPRRTGRRPPGARRAVGRRLPLPVTWARAAHGCRYIGSVS